MQIFGKKKVKDLNLNLHYLVENQVKIAILVVKEKSIKKNIHIKR